MISKTPRPLGLRPLHVLQVLGNAISGGAESYVLNLVANLPRETFRVSCVCPFESPLTRELRAKGCQVFVVPMYGDVRWDSIRSAVTIVESRDVDLLHAHLPNAHLLAGLAGSLTRRPVVASLHGIFFSSYEFGISRVTGTHLAVVCQDAYNHALSLGVPPQQVDLIRNGVDLEKFSAGADGSQFRASIGMTPDTPLVGFVGRLNPEKGPDLFVRAARLVHEGRPDVHFAIVGEGHMEHELREAIEQLGLAGNFHLAGLWTDTSQVYPALNVLVQTSRSEGMPLVVLEAMASGIPVVASAVGGVSEMVEVGTTGFLVGDTAGSTSMFPGEEEGTAKALLTLLGKPELMRKMGENGRLRARELFDIRETARRTGDLYRRLTSSAVSPFSPALPVRQSKNRVE